MKYLYLASLALSGLLPRFASATYDASSTQRGCGFLLPEGVEPGVSVNLTLENSASGVAQRRYRLHLPPSYTWYDNHEHYPVILSFHGRTQDAKYQEELSQLSNATYGFDGIAVYPEGLAVCLTTIRKWKNDLIYIYQNSKGSQQWQGDPEAPSSINDVVFTLELLDLLESTYCIDRSRIYATGKSNGGGFTGLLACDPDATARIAAFAPVSGAFYLDENQQLPACNPSRIPIPFMELHGFKDTTIPYSGGANNRETADTTSIVSYIDAWAERDGFGVDANQTSALCSGSQKVTRYSWNDTVVHYNYTNVYHDWMSSFPNGDTAKALTCKEAEATSLVLDWFNKWSLEESY